MDFISKVKYKNTLKISNFENKSSNQIL